MKDGKVQCSKFFPKNLVVSDADVVGVFFLFCFLFLFFSLFK